MLQLILYLLWASHRSAHFWEWSNSSCGTQNKRPIIFLWTCHRAICAGERTPLWVVRERMPWKNKTTGFYKIRPDQQRDELYLKNERLHPSDEEHATTSTEPDSLILLSRSWTKQVPLSRKLMMQQLENNCRQNSHRKSGSCRVINHSNLVSMTAHWNESELKMSCLYNASDKTNNNNYMLYKCCACSQC